MKSKYLFIIIIVVCMSLLLLAACTSGEKMDLSKITKGRLPQIASVVDKQEQTVILEEFLVYYNGKQYRKYHGQIGNTAHRAWKFYDADGQLLFVFTDLGNRNLVRVEVDGKQTDYQFE